MQQTNSSSSSGWVMYWVWTGTKNLHLSPLKYPIWDRRPSPTSGGGQCIPRQWIRIGGRALCWRG